MTHKLASRARVCLALGCLLLAGCTDPPPPPSPGTPGTVGVDAVSFDEKLISPGVIPYTLEFEEQPVPPDFPALQAYSFAVLDDGSWLLLGGRHEQGLHTFMTSGQNFPKDKSNRFLWWFEPESTSATKLLDLAALRDAGKLDARVADALMSTNQQYHHDEKTGDWYILGGYGWDSQQQDMLTFDTLIRINTNTVMKIANDATLDDPQKQQRIAASFSHVRNDGFAVTGGVMRKLGSRFVVVFGQRFDGEYNPFAGSGFTQRYTEAVLYFALKPGTLEVIKLGRLKSSEPDQPFHRRDLPVVDDVDPASGQPRVAAFGGVFPPGKIAGYTYPVYVMERNEQLVAASDRSPTQRFSQYECPTAVVYDRDGKTIYHTFFGGIGHYYFHQTKDQKRVYDQVTQEGRNDGLPFVADVTTFLQRADGSYEEYIARDPIPGYKLRGSSIELIPNKKLDDGKLSARDVVQLAGFAPGERALIGYIFGGIEADYPLPVRPNAGTAATNALYKVWLTRTPWDGIPASHGHEAVGDFTHHPQQGG